MRSKIRGLILLAVAITLCAADVGASSTNEPVVKPVGRSAARVTTPYIDAKVSLDYPGFEGLSVDSLGKEHFPLVTMKPAAQPWRPTQATRQGSRVEYRRPGTAHSELPRWAIEIETNEIRLESHWSAEESPESLVLDADTGISYVTLLGLMETNGSIRLPAIMHFPGQGSFRVSTDLEHADPLGYATTRKEVKISFPAATREHPALIYRLKVVCIHPEIPDIAADARFDGFRRDWLDIFQINPQRRLLANNAGSDSCGFCYFEYGDIAAQTPPLAKGLTALDMVRQTLEPIIAGTNVCGMPGYTRGREDRPECTTDTLPSFLIAAEDYVSISKDESWLAANYQHFKSWADRMLATDRNGDGLVKYIVSGNSGSWPEKIKYRPANWWDTIGFGYEDAYANALAYRALLGLEQLARQANRPDDSVRYRAAADKLKAAYFKTFYNPATGILAGWRSEDGQLHDYYFLWVNGIAIHYGLVPKDQANPIMDKLLAKMTQVGYTNFALGLPGNLVPVARKDYVHHTPRFGGGTNEDGSDAFQIYENGGATACFGCYTLAALYDLGRIQDGDRILFPMLDSFAKGDFQGFGDNKMSKDWRTWNGECHGYEGFLNDNYYALLAVLDREAALKKKTEPEQSANRATSGYRNVAFWNEPGVQIAVSSHSYRSGEMTRDESVCPLNRSFVRGQSVTNGWVSSEYEHLPQWVWIHFASPRRIDKVVLYASSIATSPVEFSGQYLHDGRTTFDTLFHVPDARFDPQKLSCAIGFKPVVASDFRLMLERSPAFVTNQSWVARLAQVEVYGNDATNAAQRSIAAAPGTVAADLDSHLKPSKFVPEVTDMGQSLAIRTPWYRLVLDKSHPQIMELCWDSLGQGELGVNFLQESGAGPVLNPVFQKRLPLGTSTLTRTGNLLHYTPVEVAPGAYEQVSIRADEHGFALGLAAKANQTILMRGGLFRFNFAANQTPTSFVGRPSALMNYVSTPTYLAAPDFGTAYITRTGDAAAFYRTPSALFPATTYWVDITPQEPSAEDGLHEIAAKPWHAALQFEVQRLEPLPGLVNGDARLKRLPKYSLNMVQWRPDTGIIGNSVMSLNCGLALLFYAEQALFVPRLENGISPMALVGASVDRYFHGAPGYQMPIQNVCSPNWWSSRETAAYLVISAWYDVRTIGGMKQLRPWLEPLECLANHIEAQFGPDDLIYHRGRGTMWFDTYNFQGADAYSNAAAYRAFRCMDDLETLAGRPDRATRYRQDAARLEAVYFKSFYNPETGVLAGWRSDDGKLHDYMFPWVNGFAIYQGLVPPAQAKAILRVLLAKLDTVGFHSYPLGLPTNLLPMSPADYAPRTSGAPKQADGMDTWQVYMNGGATPALEYYVIQALYQTGQYEAAERLLWPLIESFEKGTFNAGVQLPKQKQRNPVGSAFYTWDGSRGRGEGYLPENWDGLEALFTGHFGIGFDQDGYYFESWSPLKGQRVKLDLPYMGKNVEYVSRTK